MTDVVICAGARTPFGRFGGGLREFSLPALGAHVVRAALARAKLDGSRVDELVFGINLPGSDRSIARQVSLAAGLPDHVNSFTVDRACCSSLAAVALAARAVRAGDVSWAVAGGAENLSRTPYFLEDMRWGSRLGDIQLKDQLVLACPFTSHTRAEQADWEGQRHEITFEEANAWAVRSHRRASEAQASGLLATEIVPLDGPDGQILALDEEVRPGTTLEALAALPPVYGTEAITAGNAPGLSTGGAAVVVADADVAREAGAPVLGRLLATARASGHPDALARMPAIAAELALERARLDIGDIDIIEINEAFAVVPLVSTLRLAGGDSTLATQLRDRTNVNGGAIALGHPTGASGARLLMTALFELSRRGGGLGLVTMCGGIGEAEAVIVSVAGVATAAGGGDDA